MPVTWRKKMSFGGAAVDHEVTVTSRQGLCIGSVHMASGPRDWAASARVPFTSKDEGLSPYRSGFRSLADAKRAALRSCGVLLRYQLRKARA